MQSLERGTHSGGSESGPGAAELIRRPLFESLLDHVGPGSCQATGRNGFVELLLGRVDQCLNEAVHGFSFSPRDVRKRVSVMEVLAQLIPRQSQIGRRCLEPREPTWMDRPSITARAVNAPGATEEASI
ncbi:hypothetical protein BH20ACT13_BH20ACT13_18710 [soil metagenome]